MKFHLHKFKEYRLVEPYDEIFLGERIKRLWVIKKFRVCQKCGKAQECVPESELTGCWIDLDKKQKEILLKKTNNLSKPIILNQETKEGEIK